MKNPPDPVSLSSLSVGDIARIPPSTEEFLVIERSPEDRASGVTRIKYLSGRYEVFVWDQANPLVVVTGKGRLETRIIRD